MKEKNERYVEVRCEVWYRCLVSTSLTDNQLYDKMSSVESMNDVFDDDIECIYDFEEVEGQDYYVIPPSGHQKSVWIGDKNWNEVEYE